MERTRRWLTSMSAGTEEALAAIEEFWDADADYYPVRKFPEARPCHGREEFSHFVREFKEAFPRSAWVVRELIAVGDDRILAWSTMRSEGRDSGVKLEGDIYQCHWVRHGRFFRVEDHLTLQGALHALGLQGDTLEAAGLRGQA